MDTIAFPYLFCVLGLLPAIGVISLDYVRRNKPPTKKKGYSLAILFQTWLLVSTLVAAAAEKIVLFPRKVPSPTAWICGAIFIAVVLAWIKFRWHRVGREARQRLRLFLPETQRDFLFWVPVSLLAGVAEECAYRGAAYNLLLMMTQSTRFALVACVIAFAVAHLYQGWTSAVKIGLLGFLSHIAVFLTGGLYLSIVVHATYDLLVGWLLMRLLSREYVGSVQAETAVP